MLLMNSILLLVVAICLGSLAVDRNLQNTELVFAFMIFRHGDRTPIKSGITIINGDTSAIEKLIEPWGYGQLTDKGKRTAYKTGQFIRCRYNDVIAPDYNNSEIYIRSTDSTRTKMSVLTAMNAVYPAYIDSWSEDINWVPVPYTTVPAKYDFNLAQLNCPNFRKYFPSSMFQHYPRMTTDIKILEKLSQELNIDITSMPAIMYGISDIYVSLINLGYDVGDNIFKLMPSIEAAGNKAMDILFGNDEYIALQAGVLLNKFFLYADKIIAGIATQKVRIYSAHDINVFSFEAVTQIKPRQGVPKYGSLYSLELRKVLKTGKYVVLPVYLADPHEGVEKYLGVEGCGSLLCDYDKFYNITSKNILDESTWRTQCGFSEDIEIDTTSID